MAVSIETSPMSPPSEIMNKGIAVCKPSADMLMGSMNQIQLFLTGSNTTIKQNVTLIYNALKILELNC
jgi:hypothetical protein